MRSNRLPIFTLLLTGLIVSGCTGSFSPLHLQQFLRGETLPPPLSTAKEVRGGIEVTIEEFVSATKARMTFDADVAKKGVLAILVRVENQSDKDYNVWKRGIKALLNGDPLPPIYGYQAARQVASHGYAWKGLATLAALPFGVYIRPTTVTFINRDIQQHYENIEFADKLLKPNGVAQGFVYFKLPGRWFSSKRLESLTVNVTVEEDTYGEQNGNPVHFQLPLPKLEVS